MCERYCERAESPLPVGLWVRCDAGYMTRAAAGYIEDVSALTVETWR